MTTSCNQTAINQMLRGILILFFGAILIGEIMANEPPIVIAHRGASGYLPEHTLAAKAMAHAMHADFLEQDVVLTRDHVPVVLHDIHVDTVTDVAKRFPNRARADGRYYAIDFDLAELKTLNVSERFDHKTSQPVFPKRFPGHMTLGLTIPTLAEEIQFIQGLNKSTGRQAGIYPEVKQPAWHRQQGGDVSREVLKVLGQYGYDDQTSNVYFQCFEASELKRVRHELGCKLQLIQLLGKGRSGTTDYDAMMTNEGLAAIAKYADGIGPSVESLYEANSSGQATATDLVQQAHDHGLKVHPYTLRIDSVPAAFQDVEALTAFLLKSRVDGAFTDFPDVTRSLFKNRDL